MMQLILTAAPVVLQLAGGATVEFPAAPGVEISAPHIELVLPAAPAIELGGGAAVELIVQRVAIELAQGAPQGPPPGRDYHTDNFVADAAMLAAKQVSLSYSPADPAKVELIAYTGCEQRAGVDFTVAGQILSWPSLALDLLLEVGTAFSVRYVRS